jgi:hypothetical protein
MSVPTKINMKIIQGSTFIEVLRYESDVKVYTPITAIFNTAPMSITATAHGMVVGWRAKISNVLGMTEANNLDWIIATTVGTNSVTFNSVNAAGFKTYTSGGILEYNAPVSLSGMTARMQIREKLASTTIIEELTTENGKITIDDTGKTIVLQIPATTTATYTFKSATYSLELVSGTTIIPFIYGNITLDKEVTR